jgi:hypothetical protein
MPIGVYRPTGLVQGEAFLAGWSRANQLQVSESASSGKPFASGLRYSLDFIRGISPESFHPRNFIRIAEGLHEQNSEIE